MQRWFVRLAACGVSAMLVSGVSAQVQIQIQIQAQVQPAQAQPAQAQPNIRIGVMPVRFGVSNRLAQVDAVVVGRVVAFEPMDVQAEPAKGQPKASYRIAVVQVTEAIYGLKKGTENVRVGFIVAGNGQPGINGGAGGVAPRPAIQPIGGLRRPFPGNGTMNLTIGQDGLFFLTKHSSENFFLAPPFNNFVSRENNTNFDDEVKSAKQICKVMADAPAGLKATEKDDRFTAAAILVSKYRTNTTGLPMKEEAIDAAQSKLILKAIAEGDWTNTKFNQTIPSPYELFNQLGITANDGYKLVNVRTQQDIAQVMQKWLSENGDKYVIKKLVADPNAKVNPNPLPLPPNGRPLPPGVRIQPAPGGAGGILPVPVPNPNPAPQQNDK